MKFKTYFEIVVFGVLALFFSLVIYNLTADVHLKHCQLSMQSDMGAI